MVLTGAVVFLLEWVGLIWGAILGVGNPGVGDPTAALIAAYQGNENVVALMEGWFSVVLFGLLFGPLGLSALCSAWVMWRSGLFPTVLSILGIVAGAGAGMTVMTMFGAPAFASVYNALGISVVFFWIWIFWTGVLLWIRAPRRAAVAVEGAAAAT